MSFLINSFFCKSHIVYSMYRLFSYYKIKVTGSQFALDEHSVIVLWQQMITTKFAIPAGLHIGCLIMPPFAIRSSAFLMHFHEQLCHMMFEGHFSMQLCSSKPEIISHPRDSSIYIVLVKSAMNCLVRLLTSFYVFHTNKLHQSVTFVILSYIRCFMM